MVDGAASTDRRPGKLLEESICAQIFTGSAAMVGVCLSPYWAMRTRSAGRMHRMERFADWTFILAMVFVVFICVFITYAVSAL